LICKMKIEYAKIRDTQELADIDKIGNKELKGWSPNSKLDFIKNIKKLKYKIIIAKEKNKIIGYLSLRLDKDSRWIWVEDVYVIKDLRNKGIAGDLIRKAINFRNDKFPARRLVLLTPDRNLNIFSRLGFKKTMNFMEYKNA